MTMAGMFFARGMTAMICTDQVNITVQNWFKEVAAIKVYMPFELGAVVNKRGVKMVPYVGWPVIIALIVVVLVFLMLRYTRLGRNIYAIGGNQQSALMLGINVKLTRFWSYVLSGSLSGLAGFVFLMHKPAGNASVALRSEMDAIASSIIGGTLLTGGVGNVIGSFFGTMILGTIQKIIALSPLNASWWQEMANGAMLGLFIMLQSVILMRRHNKKH